MDDILYFRSRYISTKEWGDSGKKIPGRASEIAEIRSFEQSDDARDIAWKQSAKSETEIYTKIRRWDSTYNIILVQHESHTDDFHLPRFPRSRNIFFHELDTAIKRTKKILRISYKKIIDANPFTWKDCIDKLIQEEVRDSIIFIVTGNLEDENFLSLKKIAKYNDIIILHVFHPIELDPSIASEILFESKKIDQEKYLKVFEAARKECEKTIKKNWMSYILLSSEENPIMRLNFYFKHRYTR